MPRGRRPGSVSVRSGRYTKVARAQARYDKFAERCSDQKKMALIAAVAAASVRRARAPRAPRGPRGPRSLNAQSLAAAAAAVKAGERAKVRAVGRQRRYAYNRRVYRDEPVTQTRRVAF